jgi:hypothetical protein
MNVIVVFPVNMCSYLLDIWEIKHRERNMNPHCTLRKHTHTHNIVEFVSCRTYICKWLALCVTKLTVTVMVFVMYIEAVIAYVFQQIFIFICLTN